MASIALADDRGSSRCVEVCRSRRNGCLSRPESAQGQRPANDQDGDHCHATLSLWRSSIRLAILVSLLNRQELVSRTCPALNRRSQYNLPTQRESSSYANPRSAYKSRESPQPDSEDRGEAPQGEDPKGQEHADLHQEIHSKEKAWPELETLDLHSPSGGESAAIASIVALHPLRGGLVPPTAGAGQEGSRKALSSRQVPHQLPDLPRPLARGEEREEGDLPGPPAQERFGHRHRHRLHLARELPARDLRLLPGRAFHGHPAELRPRRPEHARGQGGGVRPLPAGPEDAEASTSTGATRPPRWS